MSTRVRLLSLVVIIGLLAVYGGVQAWQRWGGDDDEAAAVRGGLEEFLAPWDAAVANADDEPATVVVVGDSISEGFGLPAPVYARRWIGLLQDDLRDAAGVSGSAGYMPAYYADQTTPDDTVRSGGDIVEETFGDWGLGGRAALIPGGASITYPAQESTRIRVWYGRAGGLGGEAKILIDGLDMTEQGTLSAGGASGDLLSSVDVKSVSGLWWSSPELDAGSHVVEVVSTVPDAFFVHTGVEFFDGDDTSGVRVIDGSHSGAAAAHFAGKPAERGHWNEVAKMDPDLIVINLGTNLDPGYATSLSVLTDHALAAAPKARVLLVDGYEPGSWTSDEWDEVREIRRSVAAENPDRVAVFDLAAQWPALAKDGSTNNGLMLESAKPVHPNEEGHRRMAEIFTLLLSPPEN